MARSYIFLCILVILALVTPGWSDTIVVKQDGTGDFTTIQVAIDNSSDTDIIEVHPGIYYEHINFYGKAITVTSTDPNNINVVYATTIDGSFTGNVVTFDSGEVDTSALIGVNVQNGINGIYCYYSDPLISKCVIRYHNSGVWGDNSEVTISDCIIRENDYTGIHGCDGIITECDVTDNLSWGIDSCSGPISRCTIKNNSSFGIYSGGGNNNPVSSITNCIVSGNGGSGIQSYTGKLIENCTIVGNKNHGCTTLSNGLILSNNIIVLNWRYGISGFSGTLRYNNVWGNLDGNYTATTPGATDTHENPLFAVDGYWDVNNDWIEGDYHLKSIAGRWDTDINTWVNDTVTSLCIDAGDPTGLYIAEPSPNGEHVNQGAYGGTEKASKSPWGPEPYCSEFIPGDANFDCKLNMLDFTIIAARWLDCNLIPADACW